MKLYLVVTSPWTLLFLLLMTLKITTITGQGYYRTYISQDLCGVYHTVKLTLHIFGYCTYKMTLNHVKGANHPNI